MLTFAFHPPFSAFPVALIAVVVLLEIVTVIFKKDWSAKAATFILILAVIGVIAAFFSGYQASEHADQSFKIPDEAIAQHHLFGKLLLFVSIPCLVLKFFSLKAKYSIAFFKYTYLVFLFAALGLVIQTGYLGGKLVFELGAGVKAQSNK